MRSKFHGLTPWHHLTGDWSRLSALTINELASLKSFGVAPDQYPVVQVALSQLPPSVIHSSVRNTSQTQIAFLGSDGSTVQRLLRHHVHGVPLGHRRTFLPCLNCSSENAEYTVRMPLASVLGWVVLHGTEDMLAPSSTAQKQIALVGSSGCGTHKADVQSAYCCLHSSIFELAACSSPSAMAKTAAAATSKKEAKLNLIRLIG